MKKISRFLSVAVLCCGLLANGAVAYANEISPNSFNSFEKSVSTSGILVASSDNTSARASVIPFKYTHFAGLDANLRKTMYRASSTISIFGTGGNSAPDVDLYLNVYLYKDGHSYTSSSKTKYSTTTLTVSTKLVKGQKSQFGASATGTITDASGNQVYKKTLETGNPFDD